MHVVQRGGRSSGHVQNGRAVGDDDDGSGDDHERGDGQRDTDRHPRSLNRQGEREPTIETEVRNMNYINSSKGINPVDGPMLGKKSCW